MLVMLFFVLIAHCWNMDDGHSCSLSKYWSSGFVALQAAINAAIIQVRKVLIINISEFHRHQILMKDDIYSGFHVHLVKQMHRCGIWI